MGASIAMFGGKNSLGLDRESHIPKLRHLTKILVESSTTVRWGAGSGDIETENVLQKDEVAILDSYLPAGSHFPVHKHCTKEMLVVYQGELIVDIGGEEKRFGVGDVFTAAPHMPHSVRSEVETRLIAITIPADEGFTDG